MKLDNHAHLRPDGLAHSRHRFNRKIRFIAGHVFPRRAERVELQRFIATPDGLSRRSDRGGGLILGLILILIGAYFLAREYLPEVDLDVTWPVVVVAVGVVLVLLALVPSRSRD